MSREEIIRQLESWLPVLAYVVLIFALSSIPDLKPPSVLPYTDKLAHAGEYGILGLLLARAFRLSAPGAPAFAAALLALGTGAGVGYLDERFQRTVGRNYSLLDWGADVTGIVLALALFLIAARIEEKRRAAARRAVLSGDGRGAGEEDGTVPSARRAAGTAGDRRP